MTEVLRIGIVGTDFLHALKYASLLNLDSAREHPGLRVSYDREAQAGGARLRGRCSEVRPTPRWSAQELLRDPVYGRARAVCWWGPDRAVAEDWAARTGVPTVCEELDEMVGLVDAVLICSRHGAEHYGQALPFLRAGKHTFIDKPFCEDVGQALEMVAAASASGAVLYSSSPWKWAPAIADLRARLVELGGVRTLVCSAPGAGGDFFYVTHAVETLRSLAAAPITAVQCLRDELHHTILLHHADGQVGVVNAMRETSWCRHVVAYGANGWLEADITDEERDEAMVRLMAAFIRALATGRPPAPPEHSVEAVAAMVAAVRSAEAAGQRVALSEVLP